VSVGDAAARWYFDGEAVKLVDGPFPSNPLCPAAHRLSLKSTDAAAAGPQCKVGAGLAALLAPRTLAPSPRARCPALACCPAARTTFFCTKGGVNPQSWYYCSVVGLSTGCSPLCLRLR
jgi:hypothetical protein